MADSVSGGTAVAEAPSSTPAPASAPASASSETPSPSAAPAESVSSGSSSPAEDRSPSQAAAPATEIPDDVLYRRIADLDPELIARLNRKFAGHVGNQADRLARQREAAIRAQTEAAVRAEIDANAVQRELQARDAAVAAALRENDPDQLTEAVRLQREAQDRVRQMQAQYDQAVRHATTVAAQAWENVRAATLSHWETLPVDVQQQLADKQYPGTTADGVQEYWADVTRLMTERTDRLVASEVDKRVESELVKRTARLQRDIEQAVSKEAVADKMRREPSPDLGGGQSTPGAMTRDEYRLNARLPSGQINYEWIRQNRDRINGMARSG